jgi:hypothetical protein
MKFNTTLSVIASLFYWIIFLSVIIILFFGAWYGWQLKIGSDNADSFHFEISSNPLRDQFN